MTTQSSNHFDHNREPIPGGAAVFAVVMLGTLFGIAAFALAQLFASPASVASDLVATNDAAIQHEAAKDVWLERGTSAALAPYSTERREALKDAYLTRGSLTTQAIDNAQPDHVLTPGLPAPEDRQSSATTQAIDNAQPDYGLTPGLLAKNYAAVQHEAAKDSWLERGNSITGVAYSVVRQEALKDAFLSHGR